MHGGMGGMGGGLNVHLVDGGFLFKWVALAIPWKTYLHQTDISEA